MVDHAAEAERRLGQTVAGKYRLERLLGAGGMGAVYEALHEFTQRWVAVKLMHPNIARSTIAAERFLREARAPGTIGHPGIVEVLDGGRSDDGSLYLVMEKLEGETLADAMRRGRMHLQEIGAIALDLLDILHAAHEAGFVHRDIKPDNVFLALGDDEEGAEVKLLDFGVASVMSAAEMAGEAKLTRAGAVLGTPLYMSPEQALGRSIDGRADLWSVGAMLYQALSGQPPFRGETFQALVVSISTQDHVPLGALRPDLPARVEAVVERALRKDPNKRWQTAAEMADALQSAIEGRVTQPNVGTLPFETLQGLPPTAQTKPATSARSVAEVASEQPPWRIAMIGIAAISLLGVVGYALTRPAPRAASATQLSASAALSSAAVATSREASAASATIERAREPEAAPEQGSATAPAALEPAKPEPAALEPAKPEPAATRAADAVPARGLSQEQLASVLQTHQASVQRCYEQLIVAALTRGEPAPGVMSLEIALRVDSSGRVSSAQVSGAGPESLRSCVEQAVRAFAFPATDAETALHFPVVFQPAVVGQ